MKLFSIVIPTRNRPGYLEQCLGALESSIGKHHGEVEIHVVDDGSESGAREANGRLCSNCGARLHQMPRNRGMSVARGEGADASTASWIAFIDDDIVVDKQWYAVLKQKVSKLDTTDVGIEGRVEGSGQGVWDREVENLSGGLYLTCHIVYRKEALVRAGGFDKHFEFEGPFHEDHELAARVLQIGTVPFIPEMLATHLPRTVHPVRYVAGSVRRMRELLNAEIYFFLKQRDRYHLFRYTPSFWATYAAIAIRHVYTTLHRRCLVRLLRNPVQTIALILATAIEQVVAWTMLPRLLRRYLTETPSQLSPFVDFAATFARWQLKNQTSLAGLRLRRPAGRLLGFAATRRPVYDQIPSLRAVKPMLVSRPPLRFFLRIDDVFLSHEKQLGQLVKSLGEIGMPYLAAVTGNDLQATRSSKLLDMIRESGGSIGIHGFRHEGRFGPYVSEILQLTLPELTKRLEPFRALGPFDETGFIAFVPPFNAVNAMQVKHLGELFPIVCGGPESARFTERLMGPLILTSGSVYFPSYFPFYADSSTIQKAVLRHKADLFGDICLTVHMPEECANGCAVLMQLARTIAQDVRPWTSLIAKETADK